MNERRPAPWEPRPGELLRDRLLLYVRALRIPPREGLALVLETLDGLCEPDLQTVSTPGEPVFGPAMDRLRALCAERGYGPGTELFPKSVPPYNRGSMPPACLAAARSGSRLGKVASFLKGLPRRDSR